MVLADYWLPDGTGAEATAVLRAHQPDVAEAVRRAVDGEILVPARQLAKLLARRRERSRRSEERARRLDSLTPRERQILISYTTVRSHVRHLLSKMGARSKLEAVVHAAAWDAPAIGA